MKEMFFLIMNKIWLSNLKSRIQCKKEKEKEGSSLIFVIRLFSIS